MQYQTSLTRGAPDDEAIKLIQFYESLALEYDPRGYCVGTSEGKDSRVLGHLYRRAGVKHFYARSITGIDPPELVYFARKNFQQYNDQGYLTYEMWYKKSIWQMMREKLIPPLRNSRWCCAELKECRHEKTDGCLMSFGVRKAESVKRSKNRNELEIVTSSKKKNIIMAYDNEDNRKTFETCYADNERRVNPIIYWSDADIWEYSHDVGLEQCSLYNEGFKRLGCIGCPMARKQGRFEEFARYPGIERLWRNAFDDMYRIRVEQGKVVMQASGAEWFEQWMNDERSADVDDMQESWW